MIYHHNAVPVSKSLFCKSDLRTTVARSLSKGGLVTFDYIFVWQMTKSSFSSEVFLPSKLSIWSWLDIGSKVTVDKSMWTMMALLISQHPNLWVYQPLCRFPGEAGDSPRFARPPVIPSATSHSWEWVEADQIGAATIPKTSQHHHPYEKTNNWETNNIGNHNIYGKLTT